MTTKTTPMRLILWAAMLASMIVGASHVGRAAYPDDKGKGKSEKMTKTKSGLQYLDVKEGTGDAPKKGDTCVVHYTGWLWENEAKGKKFDSSVDSGKPFEFQVGEGMVIKGWDEGVLTMKPGGKRNLLIPAELGYGSRGAGRTISPNATLLFEVELIKVKP